jgi:hypothetical protein
LAHQGFFVSVATERFGETVAIAHWIFSGAIRLGRAENSYHPFAESGSISDFGLWHMGASRSNNCIEAAVSLRPFTSDSFSKAANAC